MKGVATEKDYNGGSNTIIYFSPLIRRWPRHVKSASPPAESEESWKEGTDCCFWDGVTCDLQTGLVTGLNLSSSLLLGTLHSNNSLFSLHHLRKLDLSFNDFSASHISSRFGQFSNLTHLKLTYSNFAGQVPSEISNLSKLVSLDLSWNSDPSLEPISFDKIVRNLTKLRELDLSRVDMSLVAPDSLMNLSSSLSSLRLGYCGLQGKLPSSIGKLKHLRTWKMLVGGLVVLKLSINQKKSVVFCHIRSLGFCSFGLAFYALFIIALEEAIFMVWGFLEGLGSSLPAVSVFLGKFLKVNLEAGPCPCVDLSVLLPF
ncbi:hypothetical protein DKX38_018187 [Salix brachista]|uniref:Leucine-rich repeat-containing N-terminal plant-type domain-containing protein n=1 Tax=Salix brachista TaxID=2182728 RepID=A0A5N5KMH3_9ROSI|nr:hypothetical protein DKX38_018187 [Salix brachista]